MKRYPDSNARDRREFIRIADELYDATCFHSSIMERQRHPAYEKLVLYGPSAVPIIMDQLLSGDYRVEWFPLLRKCSGENPVSEEYRGSIPQMTRSWIEWWSLHRDEEIV